MMNMWQTTFLNFITWSSFIIIIIIIIIIIQWVLLGSWVNPLNRYS